MTKSINEIPQVPMNCFQAANAMRGLKPGDEHHNNVFFASDAEKEMKKAGWRVVGENAYGGVYTPPQKTGCGNNQ